MKCIPCFFLIFNLCCTAFAENCPVNKQTIELPNIDYVKKQNIKEEYKPKYMY